MSHISRRMQKHKFGVKCPITLFLGSAPGPPWAWKEVRRHFVPQTQVPLNVTQHTFNRIRFRPTQTWEIVRQHFAPRTHQNELREPLISSDAKKISSAQHVLSRILWDSCQIHLSIKNSVSIFCASDAPKCTTRATYHVGCKNTSST
jgi:hypothetical protein